MTCIVGLLDKGKVYMGGDSAGVASHVWLEVRADPKVFLNGKFLMGFTSSFRMGQLLRYSLKVPRIFEDMDVYQYMVTVFINAVRKCLKDGGYAKKKDEVEEGGAFLVGYRSRLFEIDEDYQVAEQILPFNAVGCGATIAKGAMYANSHLEPEERILQALEAAEQFSAGVRRPFIIKELEEGDGC